MTTHQGEQSVPWHALPAEEVLGRLDASAAGLSSAEASRRLERFGENRLAVAKPESIWHILYDQLRSVVVALLVAAAAIAWAIGDPIDSAAIGVVLLINVAIGFTTELRARRAMEALRSLEVPRATVRRDGHRASINARELVPGDIVELEAGQSVPADTRLLDAAELRINEAPLTGESAPVDKEPAAELDGRVALAERRTMAYQSTAVVAGTGAAIVVATGSDTEVGRIGALTSGLGEQRTPLERRLDALGRRLVVLALGVAAGVGAIGLVRGEPIGFVAQTALALAIAAVPEGLPAVATITLALGVWRMARRHAVVRKLPAVETLGSATVVCADKTGTLTAGEMRVTTLATAEVFYEVKFDAGGVTFVSDDRRGAPDESPIADALRIAALVNRAEIEAGGTGEEFGIAPASGMVGDPTEVALLAMARAAGIRSGDATLRLPEIREIPFSSERQWMATVHEHEGRRLTLVKGAPGRLIDHAGAERTATSDRVLDDAGRKRWHSMNGEMAARGLRVLAVADATDAEPDGDSLPRLTMVALVGIADPPADGVPETIARLHDAGIRTVMITGDQRLTALAVARQLGIVENGDAVDGAELASLDSATLDARLEHVAVFNRVSPVDKLRIVEALQRRAEIVAMLGDGVNDAAALKKADIGVAMGGRGTDIAKDAADVVLADDRFATIGVAVEEGRVIFDNIRKFVFYLFSCNVAEVLVLLIAGLAGLPQPLLPLQILWLNVVTDTFPALALAVEPAEDETMARPPRDPRRAILSPDFLRWIVGYSAVITLATLGAYLLALRGDDPERARTVAFMTLALAQAAHLANARSNAMAIGRRLGGNRWAIAAVVLVIALQLIALYLPGLSEVLGVAPVSASDWGMILSFALLPVAAGLLIGITRGKRLPQARAK